MWLLKKILLRGAFSGCMPTVFWKKMTIGCVGFLLYILSIYCQAFETNGPVYGISAWGPLKYEQGFTHFEYANAQAPKGGVVSRFGYGTFDSLNPYILAGTSAMGVDLIYDTLMVQSEDEISSTYGLLAHSLKVEANQVTFYLRENAKFHDGSAITSADVVWSFKTLIKKGSPLYRSYYKNVVGVEAIDSHTVRFTVNVPIQHETPLILGQFAVFSKKYWKERDFSKPSLDIPLGSGAYKIGTVNHGQSIEFVRVEDYWAKDLPVRKGLYNFDKIIYEYYRDFTVAREAFKAGKLDIWEEYTAKFWKTSFDIAPIQDGRMLRQEFKHGRVARFQAMFFNLRNPLFQDRRVREALLYSWDFEWINKNVTYNAYTRLQSIFDNSPLAASDAPDEHELALLSALNEQVRPQVLTQSFKAPTSDGSGKNRNNLKKATQLLQQAGWKIKNGRLVHSITGEAFEFDFLMRSDRLSAVLQPFVRNLKRLGIKMNLRVVDNTTYQKRIDNFDYDMASLVSAYSHTPGREMLSYWSSIAASTKGSNNYAGVSNLAIDQLLEHLIHAKNYHELQTTAKALDRVIMDNIYAIPMYYSPTDRYAWWDHFGLPEVIPLNGVQVDTWWVKHSSVH